MKIMVVGNWEYEIYEKALFEGFQNLSATVFKFSLSDYIISPTAEVLNKFLFKNREIEIVNSKLLEVVKKYLPDLIFFHKPLLIKDSTLKEIKEMTDAKLFSYHNDNPFISVKSKLRNYFYLKGLIHYDLNYVYRPSNLTDIKKYSNKPAKILKPYYIANLHNIKYSKNKEIDLVFIGHYEKKRFEFIKYLAFNDFKINVFGPDWNRPKTQTTELMNISPSVYAEEYVKKINISRIALAFVSQKNKDVYTRRHFEITAAGTFMLSERTEELQGIFKEGVECDYFSSKEELLDKVKYYLKNSDLREKIAIAGRNKCIKSGNSNIDRSKEIMNNYIDFQ